MGKFGPAYHLVKKAQDAVYKELETPQHKLEIRNFSIEVDETTVSANSSRLLSHQGYIYISQTMATVPEEVAIGQANPSTSKCRLNPTSQTHVFLFVERLKKDTPSQSSPNLEISFLFLMYVAFA